MRFAVHGGSLAGRARLAAAAAALGARGHAVRWHGAGAPAAAGVEPAPAGAAGLAAGAEVVIGGGAAVEVALLGWRLRARALVEDLAAAELSRWNPLRRLAWHSLPALALIEPAAADAARAGRHGVALERFGLWSDGPPAQAPDVAHADTEILERACERALARAGGGAPRAAVFLDRDGTLVVERGRPAEPEDVELLPGVPAAIRLLRAAGHPVVVISNQSWIGRGLTTPARVHAGMARLRVLLRAHGVELDAIHFCPHRPDEGCDCRKPGTALLRRAADDLQLALERSVMVGDKRLDVATGQAAGGAGVLVRTGYGREEEARIGGPDFPRPPERVCDDLGAAAAWFLAREEGRTAV